VKKITALFFIVCLLGGVYVTNAKAQTPAPEIVSVNQPISAELRTDILSWLLNSPPSPARYYAVTYTQKSGVHDTYVSLVGLNIQTPDDEWSLVENPETGQTYVIWVGTILVSEGGQVDDDPFDLALSYAPGAKKANVLPMPQSGQGGGSYVRFPWQPSKAVQYGIFAMHYAGYDTDNTWLAVDFISGSDMGSGAANDSVYASVGGNISYVCNYGDSVAIKISGNGDDFLYAHLLPNANLTLGRAFAAGEMLGTLKHGSFADQCGWAAQQEDHWHLHWGFRPTGTTFSVLREFRAEGCRGLKSAVFTKGIWECGEEIIEPLGYLYHYGNISVNPDTGEVGYNARPTSPSFWNSLIIGMGELLETLLTDKLPEHHSAIPFLTPILTSVKVVIRVALVLLQGNFNLIPAVWAITFVIGFRLGIAAIFSVVSIIRMIKSIPLIP